MTDIPDAIKHYTDTYTVEELARKYPGSAEGHIMIHRKLDAINEKLAELAKRIEALS